eukprot:m.37390 g.37390  ORF g.37390 m.37390 type:complete len:65 (+) comp17649_c0_seq3:411-605(+)
MSINFDNFPTNGGHVHEPKFNTSGIPGLCKDKTSTVPCELFVRFFSGASLMDSGLMVFPLQSSG